MNVVAGFQFDCACATIKSSSPECEQGGELAERRLGTISVLSPPIAIVASSPECKQGGELVERLLGTISVLSPPIAIVAGSTNTYQISSIVLSTRYIMFSL